MSPTDFGSLKAMDLRDGKAKTAAPAVEREAEEDWGKERWR